MSINVWIWPRGDRLFDYFLPLEIGCSENPKSTKQQKSALDGAEDFLDVAIRDGFDMINNAQWMSISDEIKLDTELSKAIFQNCARAESTTSLTVLALNIALLNLEDYNHSKNKNLQTRGDVVLDMLHQHFEEFIHLLYRSTTKCSRNQIRDAMLTGDRKELQKNLAFLDLILEGMTEDRNISRRTDKVVPVSQIVLKLWVQDNQIPLSKLIRNIKCCLTPDPFQTDDLSIVTPSEPSGLRKRTLLGAGGRRRVMVSGWSRIQLLRKSIYRDTHLRIERPQQKASMLIAPWRSLSLVISDVSHSGPIVLGPVGGTAVIKDTHGIDISLACHQIHLWNCSNLLIFLHSPMLPVLRNCSNIKFAPYNVGYQGLKEELVYSGLLSTHYGVVKEVINLDGSEWSILPPTSFYIQPLPIPTDTFEEERLDRSLPDEYRITWKATLHRLEEEENHRNGYDDVKSESCSAADVAYLKSKIRVDDVSS